MIGIDFECRKNVPYWQHYCHLVWGTKNRELLIDEQIAEVIARSVRSTCSDHRAILHATGIMPDHIHLAESIASSLAISEFVRYAKGSSSFDLNKINRIGRHARFGWQAEYGLISFGERSLAAVIAYVTNQAEHHATNRVWPNFETLESQSPSADRR